MLQTLIGIDSVEHPNHLTEQDNGADLMQKNDFHYENLCRPIPAAALQETTSIEAPAEEQESMGSEDQMGNAFGRD